MFLYQVIEQSSNLNWETEIALKLKFESKQLLHLKEGGGVYRTKINFLMFPK